MDYHADRKTLIPEGAVVFTSTSLNAALSCPRQWYGKNVLKQGRFQSKAFTFGSVLHACLERYLLSVGGLVPTPEQAPDQPLDSNGGFDKGSVLYGQSPGAEIDLFPDNWYTIKERDGKDYHLDAAQRPLVQALVRQAIQEGNIKHIPYGKVERRIEIPVGTLPDGRTVWYTSLIDYGSIDTLEVQDHKTTSGWKWAKTPESLGTGSQGVTYGYYTAMMGGVMADPEARVTIKHNVFLKRLGGWKVGKTPRNYFREVVAIDPDDKLPGVRVATLKRFWEEYRGRMLEIAGMLSHSPVEKITDPGFLDIPGPTEIDSDACGAFGGCPFFNTCHAGSNQDQYEF